MNASFLTPEERSLINSGRWFSTLSPTIRHDILRCAYVKRFEHQEPIATRGDEPMAWGACAKGAVQVCSTTASGKQVTLTYVEAGIWFGDVAIFDNVRRTHDCNAHGPTTMLYVAQPDLSRLLSQHTELYHAFLHLQARRGRQMYEQLEDLHCLPLKARLAKQLLNLARSHGVNKVQLAGEVKIGLQLTQSDIAELLGASRQRVNQELKALEREGTIYLERLSIVIRNPRALQLISSEGLESR